MMMPTPNVSLCRMLLPCQMCMWAQITFVALMLDIVTFSSGRLRCSARDDLSSLVTFRHIVVFPPEPHPLVYKKGITKKISKHATTCIQPLRVMIQAENVALEKTKKLKKDEVQSSSRYGISTDHALIPKIRTLLISSYDK